MTANTTIKAAGFVGRVDDESIPSVSITHKGMTEISAPVSISIETADMDVTEPGSRKTTSATGAGGSK